LQDILIKGILGTDCISMHNVLSLQHCASAERLLLYMFSLELWKHVYYVAENMHASADTMSTFYC